MRKSSPAHTTLKQFLIAHKGLNEELLRAGGSKWSIERLEEMTALELVLICGQNNIQFVYTNPENEDGSRR